MPRVPRAALALAAVAVGGAALVASGALRRGASPVASAGGPADTAPAPVAPPAASPDPSLPLIPPDRVTLWRPGIPGGIPDVTTVHTRLDPARFGDGRADAAPAINAAIQEAGDAAARSRVRQVVLLPAGTWRLGSAVVMNRSDVVLRGEGPDRTTLVVDNGYLGIHLGRAHDYGPALEVAGSVAKGARAFQLPNAAARDVRVGDVLEIDQEDPPAALLPGTRMWMNGPVWLADSRYFKRQPATDFNGPGTGAKDFVYPAPDSHVDPALGAWDNAVNYNARFTGPWRSVGQQVEVSGKEAGPELTTLTISNVFHAAFEASRRPQAWLTAARWTPSRNVPGTQWAGVEGLRIVGGPAGAQADNGGIAGRNLAYCWVRGVEVSGDPSGGRPALKGSMVSLSHAFRCEVRGSFVHHSRVLRPNSASYGIVLTNHSSDNLVEDNVVTRLCKPIMFNTSGGGNVVGYNYADDAVIEGTGWSENAIDLCHNAFSFGDLAEGNWAPNIGSDSTHGNAGWNVLFRNFASGRNSTNDPAPVANLRAVGLDAWSGPHTVVGNVLHAADMGGGVAYEATGRSHAGAGTRGLVYRLGDNGSGGTGGAWDDGTAAANLYRAGNWDNVTDGVAWDPAVGPRPLPDSLYLEAKPAFFGDLPWPWVDPLGRTAAERVRTLPAKARHDAGAPFRR